MSKLNAHLTRKKPKVAYESWVDAVTHALNHSKYTKTVVNIYECPTCGKYHIGQQRKIHET